MKHYKKTFDDAIKKSSRFNFDYFYVSEDKVDGLWNNYDEYVEFFRKFFVDATASMFDNFIKYTWLVTKVVYKDKIICVPSRYSCNMDDSSKRAAFVRHIVGVDTFGFSSLPITSNVIPLYLFDFYPDFYDHNPFDPEDDYFKYPYKYITFSHLYVVRNIDERMEMLDYAEKNKMSVVDFVNWSVNYVLNYNEDVGKEVYHIFIRPSSNGFPDIGRTDGPYIKNKNNVKKMKAIADRIRKKFGMHKKDTPERLELLEKMKERIGNIKEEDM